MSYLEELLPEFRNGAKIRRKIWREDLYICINDGGGILFNRDDMEKNDWELYQEPIDWDYIIKNKCLCWFWDGKDDKKVIGILLGIDEDNEFMFKKESGTAWINCRQTSRDEVNFYEGKKDD